jgi:hypothetical protein
VSFWWGQRPTFLRRLFKACGNNPQVMTNPLQMMGPSPCHCAPASVPIGALLAGSTYILKLSEGIPNTFNLTLYSLFQ